MINRFFIIVKFLLPGVLVLNESQKKERRNIPTSVKGSDTTMLNKVLLPAPKINHIEKNLADVIFGTGFVSTI